MAIPFSSPRTRAECTAWRETSLHADVMAFLHALQRREDPRLWMGSFGASEEGKDLPLLVLSSRGVRTPEQAREAGLPVVLIINGIHAGEVEGKEASQMLVRDLLDRDPDGLLERLTLVVVPLYNPDGNDRIDPAHRRLDLAHLEGQAGPVSGVGTRVNANGINLNRDYLRQDAVESRLLSQNVYQKWAPHLTVDCHSTNGSVHRFDLTYDIPHTMESGSLLPIRYMRESFLPVVTERLRHRTGLHTFFYGNFVADEGGEGEGWMTYTHHPRFGSNYRGLTGRLDLLLECYSYLSFADRVYTTYEFLTEALGRAAERGREMMEVVESAQAPPEKVAVRYRLDTLAEPAEILTREPRTLDGYPVMVKIPHLARFVGTEVVDRPWGYAVPEAVAARLGGHGLRVNPLLRTRTVPVGVATVEGWAPAESRRILESSSLGEKEMQTSFRTETRSLPEGTWVVPTDQPLGALATYLCEARSDDGVVQCGMIPEPVRGAEFPILRVEEGSADLLDGGRTG